MTPELLVLALAFLLQCVQFVAYSISANLDVGLGYSMSARDRPPSRPLSDRSGRLQRALTNHFEGLILFGIAVVVVTLSEQANGFTATCGWVYLTARIVYVPAYVFGWKPWRSYIWVMGFGSTVAMVIASLFSPV